MCKKYKKSITTLFAILTCMTSCVQEAAYIPRQTDNIMSQEELECNVKIMCLLDKHWTVVSGGISSPMNICVRKYSLHSQNYSDELNARNIVNKLIAKTGNYFNASEANQLAHNLDNILRIAKIVESVKGLEGCRHHYEIFDFEMIDNYKSEFSLRLSSKTTFDLLVQFGPIAKTNDGRKAIVPIKYCVRDDSLYSSDWFGIFTNVSGLWRCDHIINISDAKPFMISPLY